MTALRLVFLIIVIFSHSVISDSCYARELDSDLFRDLSKEAFCIIATKDIRTVHNRRICRDGTYVVGMFCGIGKCNIFGHDCYGGCRVSGTMKPPLSCDALWANRTAILNRFDYCTQMEEYAPPAIDMSGGMITRKYYKNECIDTCEHARFVYEKTRSDCRKTNIAMMTLEVLTYGAASIIAGPPMAWCFIMEQIALEQKNRLCKK